MTDYTKDEYLKAWQKVIKLCEEYESLLNDWYKIINQELFNACLQPIKLVVEPNFYVVNTQAFASYCIPNDSEPFLRFNLQGLINMRIEYVVINLEDEIELTEEELKDEVKEIIAGNLIHEMIHQYSREHDIKDAEIIDGVDVHTEAFKTLAEEKGLFVLPDFNGESNTHIKPNHPILKKLQFHDFLEEDYPLKAIIEAVNKSDD